MKGGTKLAVAAVVALALAGQGGHGKHHHGIGAVLDSLTAVSAGATSDSANERLGMRMAKAAGWDSGQRACLDWLWTRESGWSAWAANPKSDARGIPQNINGWSAFAPGDARSQIRWGLKYLAGRYGTPCNAWNHELADNWY